MWFGGCWWGDESTPLRAASTVETAVWRRGGS